MFNLFKRKRKLKDFSYFELAMRNGDIFYCVEDKCKYVITQLCKPRNYNQVEIKMHRINVFGECYTETNNYEFNNRFKKVVRLNGN